MVNYLPKTVIINDAEYAVRTNFKDILTILAAFNDPDLTDSEKAYICLFIFYKDFLALPEKDYEEAFKEALKFIDVGDEPSDRKGKPPPRTMDWEQDEAVLFPSINKVAGFETRQKKYIHWWTFIGYYMEITDGTYSTVLSLRQKKAKGKKLEKWESEFWNANKSLCVLTPKLTQEEKQERERLKAILG